MKDQLIAFETAKLAKEKGFNIESNFAFLRGELKSHGIGNHFFAEPLNDIIEAPSQSLLQKWLRGIHEIHISVDKDDLDWNYQLWDISQLDGDGDFPHLTTSNAGHSSYEVALELGLYEALNLID